MIRNQFAEAVRFFKERLRRTFVIVLVAYIVILALGAVAGTYTGQGSALMSASESVEETTNIDGSQDDGTEEETGLTKTIGYILHNAQSDLIIIALGIIPFVFVSGWFAAYTAVMGGLMVAISAAALGLNPAMVILTGTVAHGIFEYPAIALSTTTGIYLCSVLTRKILHKDTDTCKEALVNILRTFVCLILPLTIIAAIVEGNITGIFMDLFWA